MRTSVRSNALKAVCIGSACVLASAHPAHADGVTDAFFDMANICANPEGAPQTWRDQAVAAGWQSVPQDMFQSVARERAWPLAFDEQRLLSGASPVNAKGYESSIRATLDLMETGESLRDQAAGTATVVPNAFYTFMGNPSLSVQLPMDDDPVGSGWPPFLVRCDVIYTGDAIAPLDLSQASFKGNVETKSNGSVSKAGLFEFYEGSDGAMSLYSLEPVDKYKPTSSEMRSYRFLSTFKLPE